MQHEFVAAHVAVSYEQEVEPPHEVVFAHALHATVSLMLVWSQYGEMEGLIAISRQMVPSQTVQHPKQSQPGGEMGPHLAAHWAGTGVFPTG